MTTRLLATLALALVCCSSPIDSDGADETSSGAASVFDDCLAEDEATVTCSGDQCQAAHPAWDCAVPVLSPELVAGLEKTKVVAGSACWLLPGTDAHLCAVSLGCVDIVGRPLTEVGTLGPPCSSGSVWDATGTLGSECVVVYDALALQCL